MTEIEQKAAAIRAVHHVDTFQYLGDDTQTPARWKDGQWHAWIDGQVRATFAPTDTEDEAIVKAFEALESGK